MPPRNRPSASASASSSPSTSPPTSTSGTALTKRQRQALRIHRPPLPSAPPPAPAPAPAPVSSSSSPPSPAAPSHVGDAPLGLPATPEAEPGTSPEPTAEAIRIRRPRPISEERETERASPSKYPTPLPDEVSDNDDAEHEDYEGGEVLPVPGPGAVPIRMRVVDSTGADEDHGVYEEGVYGGGGEEVEEEERMGDTVLGGEREVPTGTLIDMQDDDDNGDTAAPMPIPSPAPAPAPAPARARPRTVDAARAVQEPQARVDDSQSTVARRSKPPSRPPAAGAHQGRGAQHGQGQVQARGQAQGERQSHVRAPEVPRHAPPPQPARSALSHTLRSALAASTQAVTSATAYAHSAYAASAASNGYAYAQVQLGGVGGGGGGGGREGRGGRGREGGGREGGKGGQGEEGEEEIVGARWDEVDVRDVRDVRDEGSSPRSRSTTRRLLTLTYTAGVQVWDVDVGGGGVREVLNLRIPSPSPSPSSSSGTGTGSGTKTRTSADTLRAVDPARRPSPFDDDDQDRMGDGRGKAGEEGEDGEEEEMYGPVLGAAVLPPQGSREGGGGLELGILTPHALYVYALSTGRVVARAVFPSPSSFSAAASVSAARDGRRGKDEHEYGPRAESLGGRGGGREGGRGGGGGDEREVGTPCSFEAAERVVVVTTHSPPALVVLARPSLRILHVFPTAALAVPHPPSPPALNSPRQSFPTYTPPPSSEFTPIINGASSTPPQTPTSALHGRLLAFLAPPPSAPLPAHDAAPLATWGRTLGRFFSRSAPAASALAASVFTGGSPPLANALAAVAGGGGEGGGERWVRVIDLAPLLAGDRGRVRDVHAFEAGRAPVGCLSFSRDGTRLFVVRRDGLGASVWGLRPSPLMAADGQPQPAHLYALRRGRTGAVVEALAGARDGRFVALATRRRTVHVFAVNPYGGRADVRSHLGGKVRDAVAGVAGVVVGSGSGEESATEVRALVRMRLPSPPHGAEDAPPLPPPAPLAIAFVPASAPVVGLRSPISPALSSPSSNGGAPSGVQDVLVFDPADGVLSLRRITLTLEAPHTALAGMQIPLSVSLPAAKAAGRMGMSMSASPPGYAGSYARGAATGGCGTGGVGAGDAAAGELGGKESVVATWSLRRRRGWAEIRRADSEAKEVDLAEGRPVKEDWLAQAELSTFTSTPRVLPRAIYLSHQFAFYALGEDYHALIRRYQFVIGGAKIDVRREVEVSAFALGPGSGVGGEAFVEGYGSSSPRAIRRRSRTSSSFDEPLASALAGTHYRDARPPPVLPMLPNGSPASFRSSMPVRAVAGLGDGVAEGLGRLRREMRHQRQKQLARSPPTQPRKGGDDVEASMPLEFDEEDEDFALPAASGEDVFLRVHADREDDDALSATTSRNGEGSVPSVSTPATSARALEDEERLDLDLDGGAEAEWHGWATEDKLAVEEAERFDDISVVGFLDEEQAAMQAEAARRKGAAARTRTKKRR
ncbi:hypothetical protein C8R47DRAFT_809941 [Mycena vitilis]|nr:hypothetical protein C8R47DRAFT_809941 [Mycena vitilis]